MKENQKQYIAIDLKSFYASVECIERGLDPLNTNLVVADVSRTEKTICLAVTPSLKAYGIPGRARLFEVVSKVKEINLSRMRRAPGRVFKGKSVDARTLDADPSMELDYIAAKPRMKLYMDISTQIYSVYLKYFAPEDMHVYSIDEVFIDVTAYLNTYKKTAHELALTIVRDVLKTTGITATAGIGTNMYLCKIAMDIVAKHIPADEDGVRIAELDEMSYRELLWDHKPLTDFWRVGRGYSKRLTEHGLFTMGDVARCSVQNEDLLYKLFGINAELLIDHAWGWENSEIKDIKEYVPQNNSLSSGQVLQSPYSFEKARVVITEMTDMLSLDMVDKKLVTDQMVLTVGYDIENLKKGSNYKGEVVVDHYGRAIPKGAHGSINIGTFTSSTRLMTEKVLELFDRIVDSSLYVRRMYVVANHIIPENKVVYTEPEYEQLDLFTDYEKRDREREEQKAELEKERSIQEALLDIKKKYGKNSILKGTNFKEGATARERNAQIGGHKA
ncbi:MAG: DNA methylase [Lachnospiraceae bacterium]|nr:DNA methylase [Lachnospiraceae bacterium]